MDRFINGILPEVPGCPEPFIKSEVLRAAIRFCKESRIWQQDEEKTVAAGNDEITFSIPADAALAGVRLSVNGYAATAWKRSGLTVTLDTAVSADTTFDTTCFLVPAMNAAALPDFLYDDWFEAVASLAKANLMLMPKKPWHQPDLALVHTRAYLHECGNAKIEARKVNDQTMLMVQQRPFI